MKDVNTASTLQAESLCGCINLAESFLLIMLTVGFVLFLFFVFGMNGVRGRIESS